MALEHVLWIGGPTGCGKTTVASRIARRYGLRLYSADTRTWEHRDRAIREGNAAAIRWEGLMPHERWSASPSELVEMSLHHERGRMVVDDLARLPRSPLIVAEGTTISPSAVSDPGRAVWLSPTRVFERAPLDPGAARLHSLLAEVIESDARKHGVRLLIVDRGIDETVAAVEGLFADALASGPRAKTLTERRELLREANEAIVQQVRSYYVRPWAQGNPDAAVRTFLCECGDPSCDLTVELAVGAVKEGAVLAPGHG